MKSGTENKKITSINELSRELPSWAMAMHNNIPEEFNKLQNRTKWISRVLFKWFKKDMIKLSTIALTPVPEHKYEMNIVWRDSNDKAYLTYKNDADIPLMRKLFITEAYVNLVNQFTDIEVNNGLLCIHDAINERDPKGNMKPNIAKTAFICAKLLGRSGRFLNEDLMYKLAAHYFVRSDEAHGEVDEVILTEKITALKTQYRDGVREWFFSRSLNDLYPFLNNDAKLFEDILEESKVQTESFASYMKMKV